MNDLKAQLETFFKDDAKAEAFANCPTPEAAHVLLAENGIDMAADEIVELVNGMKAAAENDEASGELSEDSLESVAGGSRFSYALGYAIGLAIRMNRYRGRFW